VTHRGEAGLDAATGGVEHRDVAKAGQHDLLLPELLGQPATLRRSVLALEGQAARLEQLAEVVRGIGSLSASGATGGIRPLVVLTGMGSSLDACRAAAPILSDAGVPAVEVEAAELAHYRWRGLRGAGVVVLVSQSGRSAEVLRTADLVREAPDGPTLVTVTNGFGNALAGRGAIAFDTGAGVEEGPSTGSFAASLVTLAAVSELLGGSAVYAAVARARDAGLGAAAALEALLADPGRLASEMRGWLGSRRSLVTLGRGTGLAAAGVGALILKEAGHFHAESLPAASFRHGPLELADANLATVVLAIEPATRAFDEVLAEDLVGAGSAVCWIGPAGRSPDGALAIEIPTVARPLAPAVAIAPLQLLAWRLAVDAGLRPGEFTRASKVTDWE
jgi:glutamine---fructose-6-phosphate transaminase (isomerizing)